MRLINIDDFNVDIINNKVAKGKYLQKIEGFFLDMGLLPIYGIEIEFYLPDFEYKKLEEKLEIEIKKEKGLNQYEVDFGPYNNSQKMIEDYQDFVEKSKIYTNSKIIFNPKPFDDYGNGMHFHVNFIDKNSGENYFECKENREKACFYLCENIIKTFFVFGCDEKRISRFNHKFMAPVNVSFSNNNRTVPIRVPDLYPKRVEHRIACSTDNIETTLFIILKSIYSGIKNAGDFDVTKYKIFGNAFDSQYSNLIPFPKSVHSALNSLDLDFFDV